MKLIKVHIATAPFCYVEVEFDSLEEFQKEYAKIYAEVAFRQALAEVKVKVMQGEEGKIPCKELREAAITNPAANIVAGNITALEAMKKYS